LQSAYNLKLVPPNVGNVMTTKTSQKTLISIQYLRALAALMVVFHHAHMPLPGLYNPLKNYVVDANGVSIFFVISGYIMYAAAKNESVGEFAWKRITRIVPLYWLAIFALFCTHYSFDISQTSRINLLKSLLFIPFHNPEHLGEIWPLLVPGWTLNYEMFFYAIFAIGLATRRLIPVLVGVMIPLVIAGWLFPSHNALWTIYTGPLLLEFLGGVLLAVAFERGKLMSTGWMLPVGAIALLASVVIPLPHLIIVSVPAAMIVCGAVALERRGLVPTWPRLLTLGNASYSIYLVHLLVLPSCWRIVKASGLAGMPQFLTMIALGLFVSCAAGLAVHFWIEKPLLKLFRKLRAEIASRGRDQTMPAPSRPL
jgi:exopolysaccharide production protein ExoZ